MFSLSYYILSFPCFLLVKPGIPTIGIQPNKTVLCQTQTINLACSATTGKPGDTNITFYNNDEYIGSTMNSGAAMSSTIMGSYMTSLKNGSNSFKCKATNQAGTSEGQPQTVTAKGRIIIEFPDKQ